MSMRSHLRPGPAMRSEFMGTMALGIIEEGGKLRFNFRASSQDLLCDCGKGGSDGCIEGACLFSDLPGDQSCDYFERVSASGLWRVFGRGIRIEYHQEIKGAGPTDVRSEMRELSQGTVQCGQSSPPCLVELPTWGPILF